MAIESPFGKFRREVRGAMSGNFPPGEFVKMLEAVEAVCAEYREGMPAIDAYYQAAADNKERMQAEAAKSKSSMSMQWEEDGTAYKGAAPKKKATRKKAEKPEPEEPTSE